MQVAGGFVTDSLSEDYFTGIHLSAQGYRLIYLDEKLSAGLTAENISAHATQRLRWAQVGAEIALTPAGSNLDTELPVTLEIMGEQLQLPVKIVKTRMKDEFATVRVGFEQVNLSQHRRLVEILFCRPGQWQRQLAPGEFQSLLLIFKILLKPRVLFDRNIDVNAIAVSQG